MSYRKTPTSQQLLQAIQEELETLLQAKTNWGRNELMLLIEKAKTNALLRFI